MSTGETPFLPPQWSDHGRKHHPIAGKPWPQIKVDTGKTPKSNAIYHSLLNQNQLRQLEMSALNQDLDVNVAVGWREILPQIRHNIRMFWREIVDLGHPVGASKGEDTYFVLVKYDMSGTVHGQPITREELRKKGADL